eukprot:159562_1
MCLLQHLLMMQFIGNSLSFFVENVTLPVHLATHQLGYNNQTSEVFLFGGSTGSINNYVIYTNAIYKRNISDNNSIWINITTTTLEPIFEAVAETSTTVNDSVYFMGVFNGSANVNSVYVFNLTSEKFVENNGIPAYPHMGAEGCVVSNLTHIFMVGGTFY